MSNFKIIGNPNPEIGKEIIYKISNPDHVSLLPGQITPVGMNPFVEQVKWSIYILEFGKWILKEKNNKTGPTANYTFTEKSLKRKGIRIVARLGEEKAILDIKPQDTIERRIVKVELCDALGNLQTKPFAYNQTVLAKVHCLNLNDCTVHVTLWEDDAPGAGHSEINKNNKAVTKSERISNGIANIKFKLAIDFAKIANAQLAKGDKSEGKTHEYYVTAEVFRQKTESSNNINVINPEKNGTAAQATPQKPSPRPTDPAAKKGKSKKEEKGIAETVSGTIYDWGETILKAIPIILPDPIEVVNSLAKIFTPDKKDDKKDEKKGACVCKENNFYWSDKLTCDERKKVLEVCANIWGEDKKKDKASELMAIMHLETIKTFSPSKKGVSSGGTKFIGLVQFSAVTAKSIGTTYEELGKMTFIEQMKYVEIYLKQNKDKMKTLVDFYLQVLKPGDVGMGDKPNHAVFDESVSVPDGDGSNTTKEQRDKNINKEPWVTKYGYASNPTFMTEKDEKVKRKRWVYTRQAYEERYGTIGGKTTIKEIDDVLRNEHYKPGAVQLFKGKCDDVVEEKKKETNGERAPWMEIVLEEAKKYGGYTEGGKNVLNERIKNEYFSIKNEGTNSKSDPSKVSWCAAFASWCLQKKGYANPSTCRALEFDPNYIQEGQGKEDKKLSHMRKISEPVYGCIIVWKNTKGGGGHVAFYYGKTATGNIIPIGGNQGSSLQFSNRKPNGDGGQKIVGYFLPEDYADNPNDKFKDEELKLDPVKLNKSDLLAKNGFVSTKT
ncbi:MAG: TIGR02594 family protein [Flavobacterium sp.]